MTLLKHSGGPRCMKISPAPPSGSSPRRSIRFFCSIKLLPPRGGRHFWYVPVSTKPKTGMCLFGSLAVKFAEGGPRTQKLRSFGRNPWAAHRIRMGTRGEVQFLGTVKMVIRGPVPPPRVRRHETGAADPPPTFEKNVGHCRAIPPHKGFALRAARQATAWRAFPARSTNVEFSNVRFPKPPNRAQIIFPRPWPSVQGSAGGNFDLGPSRFMLGAHARHRKPRV